MKRRGFFTALIAPFVLAPLAVAREAKRRMPWNVGPIAGPDMHELRMGWDRYEYHRVGTRYWRRPYPPRWQPSMLPPPWERCSAWQFYYHTGRRPVPKSPAARAWEEYLKKLKPPTVKP